MNSDERLHESWNPRVEIFGTVLKRKCSEIILKSGLRSDQVSRVIPRSVSESLLSNLLAQSNVMERGNLNVNSSGIIRELLSSHTQVLTLKGCSIHSKHLDTRELVCALSENSRLNTLIVDNLNISAKDAEFLKVFGTLMERVTCLRYGSVFSDLINHPKDELFAQLARDHLSKNRNFCFVDLRESDVDLIATNSKRNLPINFAGEMRRWARRLKGLAFETDVSLHRVLRILNRQCPLLKSICIKTTRSVLDAFDNLREVLDSSADRAEHQNIEQLPKLKILCLCGHFRVTDRVLQCILPSVPALIFLNISGCAVNFEQYCTYLPPTLEELVIDDCNRSQLLKEYRSLVRQLLQKCSNLTIFVSKPQFEDEEFESLKGLALLNGAKSILCQKFEYLPSVEDDDGLIAFELRVKELDHKYLLGSSMYGIPDFEAKIAALPESELTPNLSTELGRIPWPQERQEFMPKPMSKHKFVYKADFLSDRLIEQQERAQAFQNNLMNKFRHVTQFYNKKKNEIEDRFDDKDLLPTIGLGSLAGLIAWKSNQSSPFPLKAIFCLAGMFTSSLLTHEKLRSILKEEISSNIPDDLKAKVKFVDDRIGIFGADTWSRGEDLFNQLKNKILNKLDS